MSLKFLEEEFNKLDAKNRKFGDWEDKVDILINSGKLISLKIFETLKGTPIDWDTLLITSSIATFTLNDDAEKFEVCLNQAIKQGAIKGFERKKTAYELIADDDTKIKFFKLTDVLPDLNDDTKKILQSLERQGCCHWGSIRLSKALQLKNSVVSGDCTMASKKMPYSHSWVELEQDGEEWVLDFTINEVMNKEGYYKLHNPQNTVAIDNETLVQDLDLRDRTALAFKDIRMYLLHPDEAREVMQEEIKGYKTYETGEHPWILEEK